MNVIKAPDLRDKKSGPRRGDRFYDRTRIAKNLQPNGYIAKVLWDFGQPSEVIVFFHEEDREDRLDTYEVDFLEGKWTDSFGGCWYIEGEG